MWFLSSKGPQLSPVQSFGSKDNFYLKGKKKKKLLSILAGLVFFPLTSFDIHGFSADFLFLPRDGAFPQQELGGCQQALGSLWPWHLSEGVKVLPGLGQPSTLGVIPPLQAAPNEPWELLGKSAGSSEQ